MNGQHIPPELRKIDRWIDWRYQKHLGKVRKRPRLSLADPNFPKPYKAVKAPPDGGIGFCFTGGVTNAKGEQLLAFDFDACRDPESGALAPWLKHARSLLPPTFWEVTPSGAGLRAWLWVKNPPKSVRKMRPGETHEDVVALPHGTKKTPEIQVFGTGVANYVTVTGDLLPGALDQIASTRDVDELLDEFNGHGAPVDARTMPTGDGPPPKPKAILEKLETVPDAEQLLAGDFDALGLASASEAWWRIVEHALIFAKGHGEAVVQALLELPVWSEGLIDSAEPHRYTDENWIRADVIRIASRTQTAADVFEDLGDSEDANGEIVDEAGKKSLLIHASEFGDDDADDFTIFEVLPAVGLVQFYGDPGCGKTPFVMSAALHVAAGFDHWFDHEIDRKGAVIYMAGEGERAIRKRFRADAHELGIDLGAIPLYCTARPGQLTDRADVRIWAKEIRRLEREKGEDVVMLVIDTQAQNFGPGDESSTEHMNVFVQNTQRLARDLEICVVIVHHTGHQQKQRARGSSVMIGALDGSYEVTRVGANVTAASNKEKDWARQAPLRGVLQVVEVGVDRKGRPRTAVRLDPSPEAREFVESPFDDEGPSVDQWLEISEVLEAVQAMDGRPATQPQLRAKTSLGMTVFKTTFRKCLNHGYIDEPSETGRNRRTYRLSTKGVRWLEQH